MVTGVQTCALPIYALGVPEEQKCSNIMVQAYAKRIETAEEEKKLLLAQTT